VVAVEQDASGQALAVALAYAKGIGCTRAGVIGTTFSEETETDLFGEQSVLCGGVPALVRAGFETMVEAGYQPEIAYFECLHELKLIVDLIYQGGMSYMFYSVSDTAEHGGYMGGETLVSEELRERMRGLLAAVRDGSYAERWIEENRKGRPEFNQRRDAENTHLIEEIGKDLRSMMPFLDAKQVPK
jgi:ketol-acid reductoisomerase